MPLVIAGVHLTYKKDWLKGIGLTTLGLSLHIRSNHLQITYYLLLILLIYVLIKFIYSIKSGQTAEFFKYSIILIIPVVLGVGTNLSRIWTTMEYTKYSTRGKSDLTVTAENKAGLDRDYTFQYSNSIFEPLTMAIPNIMHLRRMAYPENKSPIS